MRSLTILQERSIHLQCSNHEDKLHDAGLFGVGTGPNHGGKRLCVDRSAGNVYIVVSESTKGHFQENASGDDANAMQIAVYQMAGNGHFPILTDAVETIAIAAFPSLSPDGIERQPVSLEYIPDLSSLCLSLSDGDLFLIRHAPGRSADDDEVRFNGPLINVQ